ncbi:MAG: MFS transporter [Proteobacteria bacterium]|nr:MFS transporter [Pseudomonadota bacterium]
MKVEASDLSGDRATNRRIFWVLYLAIFTTMLGVGNIVPLLPLYAETLGATGVWLGLIFAVFSLTRSVFSPIAGRLSDSWGRKRFLTIGLFMFWLVSLGYLVADSLVDLAAVRFVQGAAAAFVMPVAFAYVGDIAPREHEGKFVGFFSSALFLGFGLGPLSGGLLMDMAGIQANFVFMSLLCLAAFILVAMFLPADDSRTSAAGPVPQKYSAMLKRPQIWGLFIFRFTGAVARGILFTFLPLIATAQAGMTPGQIGLAVSSNVLIVAALQGPFGRLADRWRRSALVALGSAASAGMMALLAGCHQFSSILFVCILIGAAAALSMPAAMAIVIQEGRTYGQGSVTGFFNLGMSVGLGTGPILAGLAVDHFGLEYAFDLAALIGLMGALVFSWLVGSRTDANPSPPV